MKQNEYNNEHNTDRDSGCKELSPERWFYTDTRTDTDLGYILRLLRSTDLACAETAPQVMRISGFLSGRTPSRILPAGAYHAAFDDLHWDRQGAGIQQRGRIFRTVQRGKPAADDAVTGNGVLNHRGGDDFVVQYDSQILADMRAGNGPEAFPVKLIAQGEAHRRSMLLVVGHLRIRRQRAARHHCLRLAPPSARHQRACGVRDRAAFE